MRGDRCSQRGPGVGEEGSGTINCLGLIALALTLSMLLVGIGAARVAAVHLQAVADLSALAGAERSATAPWRMSGNAPAQPPPQSRRPTAPTSRHARCGEATAWWCCARMSWSWE